MLHPQTVAIRIDIRIGDGPPLRLVADIPRGSEVLVERIADRLTSRIARIIRALR